VALRRRRLRHPLVSLADAVELAFLFKQVRFAYAAWRLYRVYRVVAAEPAGYTDQAMAPVMDEDEESLELFTHNQAARDAVEHLRRVKALTSGMAYGGLRAAGPCPPTMTRDDGWWARASRLAHPAESHR
jgi:hypothetical protein